MKFATMHATTHKFPPLPHPHRTPVLPKMHFNLSKSKHVGFAPAIELQAERYEGAFAQLYR